MTRPFRKHISCPQCGKNIPAEDPFSSWVRAHPGLDSISASLVVTDIDQFIWHKYKTFEDGFGTRHIQYQMILEVKGNCSSLSQSQKDTLWMTDQVFRMVGRPKDGDRKGNGRFADGHCSVPVPVHTVYGDKRVMVRLLGVHCIFMDGEAPDTSSKLTWDRTDIDIDTLVGLLRFDLNPDTLRPMNHRRHKRIRRIVQVPIWAQEAGTMKGDAQG